MKYPLDLRFKLLAFVPQVYMRDSDGNVLFYVYQRYWKLKEKIHIYENDKKEKELYQINADRIIDFSPRLDVTDNSGKLLLSMKRSGWKSLWRNRWDILINENVEYSIIEENPFVKILDATLNEVPFFGMFTGLFLNPKYKVVDKSDTVIVRMIKKRSWLESQFMIKKEKDLTAEQQNIFALAGTVVALFERRRG